MLVVGFLYSRRCLYEIIKDFAGGLKMFAIKKNFHSNFGSKGKTDLGSIAHYTSQAKLWARRVKQTVMWTVCSQSAAQSMIATGHEVCEALSQKKKPLQKTKIRMNEYKLFSMSHGEIS